MNPDEKGKAREGSRLATMKAAGRFPRLPEAPLPYLLEYLFEVGPAEAGGFGPAPLTHQELRAWQENMRRYLAPWELAMLRRLSLEWLDQARAAEDPNCPAPWDGEVVTAEEKGRVAMNLRDSLRRMAR